MDLASSLPKNTTVEDDDTEEDSDAERSWYRQGNQQEEEEKCVGDGSAEQKEQDLVNDKKVDLNFVHHPAAEVSPRPPWRHSSSTVRPPAPLRRAEPVRGHASKEGDGPYYEMFGSKREYERLVRGKTRSRRGWSHWRREQQR